MSDSEVTEPAIDPPDHLQDSATPSWTVSLCFWATLVVAAGIYAAVALAPKFCVWNQVRLEYRRNVAQLVELENDVAYLERVEVALETDPEFRDRIVGVTQPVSNDEEFIPVSGSLLFGHEEHHESIAQSPSMPAYHALTVQLASHSTLRRILLICAALLTIFAFTFLNDAGTNFVNATGRLLKSAALIPVSRYFSTDKTSSADDVK